MQTFLKKALMISLLAGCACFVGFQQAEAGRVSERLDNQQARIEQGINSGELTMAEAKSLKREERRIGNARQKALSDGKLTQKERVALENMQDRASQRISGLKHNNVTR